MRLSRLPRLGLGLGLARRLLIKTGSRIAAMQWLCGVGGRFSRCGWARMRGDGRRRRTSLGGVWQGAGVGHDADGKRQGGSHSGTPISGVKPFHQFRAWSLMKHSEEQLSLRFLLAADPVADVFHSPVDNPAPTTTVERQPPAARRPTRCPLKQHPAAAPHRSRSLSGTGATPRVQHRTSTASAAASHRPIRLPTRAPRKADRPNSILSSLPMICQPSEASALLPR